MSAAQCIARRADAPRAPACRASPSRLVVFGRARATRRHRALFSYHPAAGVGLHVCQKLQISCKFSIPPPANGNGDGCGRFPAGLRAQQIVACGSRAPLHEEFTNSKMLRRRPGPRQPACGNAAALRIDRSCFGFRSAPYTGSLRSTGCTLYAACPPAHKSATVSGSTSFPLRRRLSTSSRRPGLTLFLAGRRPGGRTPRGRMRVGKRARPTPRYERTGGAAPARWMAVRYKGTSSIGFRKLRFRSFGDDSFICHSERFLANRKIQHVLFHMYITTQNRNNAKNQYKQECVQRSKSPLKASFKDFIGQYILTSSGQQVTVGSPPICRNLNLFGHFQGTDAKFQEKSAVNARATKP